MYSVGGLIKESWLRAWRVAGSKLDCTDDPSCERTWCKVNSPSVVSPAVQAWANLLCKENCTDWLRSDPRLWDRRVPGSKPDSTEDLSCIGPVARSIIRRESNVLPLVWCGTLERGFQLRCLPRHLPAVQTDEVRPKIALVLLRNGMLIIKLN
ncbi:hypothetical protein AVEN_21865-1 [Araneus ventricosus]|uniref:Uncharacterized protein n=1 Tax=Araneus ventricosus TaxID=182803 RepID=A0A4Y2U7L1_ARAVE|nr:hypothetical protein AVEN_21865-1 [Araneus ventricosus]